MECVSQGRYIVVARTFLFPLQNLLTKIKVVELGASLLTEGSPVFIAAQGCESLKQAGPVASLPVGEEVVRGSEHSLYSLGNFVGLFSSSKKEDLE